MQIDNIPIILHTCDNYSKYWDHWWHFTNKYCHHKNIIFCSEELSPSFHSNVKTFKTGTGSWGERLIKILKYINTTHIFYMQEDFWPTKDFPYNQQIIDKVIYDQIDCWRICKNSEYYHLIPIEHNIYRYHQNSLYSLCHQFSLWRIDFLKQYIEPNENPWENEVYGSQRINNNSRHKIYFQENEWYQTTVCKGELQKNGLSLLKNEQLI